MTTSCRHGLVQSGLALASVKLPPRLEMPLDVRNPEEHERSTTEQVPGDQLAED
jgi:hypothetical protein